MSEQETFDAALSRVAITARENAAKLDAICDEIKKAEANLSWGYSPPLWVSFPDGSRLGWDNDRSGMRILFEDKETSKRPLLETKATTRLRMAPLLAHLLLALADAKL
jgi:hypothetical protein